MLLPSGDRTADSAAIGNLFVIVPVARDTIWTDFASPDSMRTHRALSESMLTFLQGQVYDAGESVENQTVRKAFSHKSECT